MANGTNSVATSSKKAFKSWSALAPADRAAFLHRIADFIHQNLEFFALLESMVACRVHVLIDEGHRQADQPLQRHGYPKGSAANL